MNVKVRGYTTADVKEAAQIWNTVVEDGIAYPQEDILDEISGDKFFKSQSYTAVAVDLESGDVVGLYILHPNNIGRVGHIGNASYAVRKDIRGQHIGERLVEDSLVRAKECGFRIMQFNAVVKTNHPALHLYEKLGFKRLGTVPGGFRMKDGHYEDIVLMYREV